MRRMLTLFAAALLIACSEDPLKGLIPGTGPPLTDGQAQLLLQADATTWAYFENRTTPFARASSSPHPETLIRVRYNTFAATQLDAGGRVKANAVFPDSSLIVKELYTGAAITTFAVMMKLNGASTSGFGGWNWAEYTPAGATRYSTSGRGAACSSCHSRGIDYSRMNDTH